MTTIEQDFAQMIKEVVIITRQILIMEECEKRILFRKRLQKAREIDKNYFPN